MDQIEDLEKSKRKNETASWMIQLFWLCLESCLTLAISLRLRGPVCDMFSN